MSVYTLIGNAPSTVGLPFTYVLDANGTVRHASQGAIDSQFLIDKVSEVLETPYGPP